MFVKRMSTSSLTGAERMRLVYEKGEDQADDKKELTSEERRQEFIDRKAYDVMKSTATEKRELQEYLEFPNIMGWFFDGTFPSNFRLREEYAEYFNEVEDELEAMKDLVIEETFTEKAYRNFWPPHYVFGGKYFRTRGIYLDLKEVKEDPPKTPPNINFEKQHGIIGIDMPTEETLQQAPGKDTGAHSHKQGFGDARDNWYWSEMKRDFMAKEAGGDYVWTEDENIWRESSEEILSPEASGRSPDDYYFNFERGSFHLKRRDMKYDHLPKEGVWRSPQDAPPPGPDTANTPKDYYFDLAEGAFKLKTTMEYGEIYLEPKTNLWMQRWLQPYDYYWDPTQNRYIRKKRRESGDDKNDFTKGGLLDQDANRIHDPEDPGEYDKPWLHNYVYQAATENRFEQMLRKLTRKKDKAERMKEAAKIEKQKETVQEKGTEIAPPPPPTESTLTFDDKTVKAGPPKTTETETDTEAKSTAESSKSRDKESKSSKKKKSKKSKADAEVKIVAGI